MSGIGSLRSRLAAGESRPGVSEAELSQEGDYYERFLLLDAVNGEMGRIESRIQGYELRINGVIALCIATVGGFWFAIEKAYAVAQSNPGFLASAYVLPYGGIAAMIIGRFLTGGIRKRLKRVLEEAAMLERKRNKIADIGVSRYADELADYRGYIGMHRESGIMLLIASGWAVVILIAHGFLLPLVKMLQQ